jgi:hypothetical protein
MSQASWCGKGSRLATNPLKGRTRPRRGFMRNLRAGLYDLSGTGGDTHDRLTQAWGQFTVLRVD